MNEHAKPSGFYSADACSLSDFKDLLARQTTPKHVPLATSIDKNIPVYDMTVLRPMLEAQGGRAQLMAEWARAFQYGAGVIVLQHAYEATDAIDAASNVFKGIIAAEKEQAGGGADHFAAAGNNDRIWNSLQKLCLTAPETHVDYFANPAIDAACESWLGPNYQMTAQVNLVRPGGQAQQAHRDYHLGFQTADTAGQYPTHVHDLSPLMTLQGGIAHCDIPIDSGPTKLLPFSQMFQSGYMAWRRDDFRSVFEEEHVQLALSKGDALFFNPALFHAAGENRSRDIHRLVNLLQVSSAFGRAMEKIDRSAMCRAAFPAFSAAWQAQKLSDAGLSAAIAATAEGYPFPTNLDTDPPVGGLAPQSQAELLHEAVRDRWIFDEFDTALVAQANKQKA
ncbi:MAG: phytanoyl-CoA dioxygenase family protein [Pseudomonadota bacterium]